MKRIAHYRKGRPGALSGMSEKCYWYLATHENKATGSELAAFLKITLRQFNNSARILTRGDGMVANITASETWKTESGHVDRLFTLHGRPKYVTPKPTGSQYKYYTKRSIEYSKTSCRDECLERAQRRARLISAGLYINEFEGVL